MSHSPDSHDSQPPIKHDPMEEILPRPSLSIDWEVYAAMLEDSDMPLNQQKELIETLWSIVVAFVDLGFDLNPVQQICGEADDPLAETLADAGGILESPSIEFGEDSDSRLVEHMLASVAQHQREKNAEQTSNRMKGRMMNGYAVFSAPIGYTYKKTGSHGKLLTRNEPLASIIQEGLEGYASSRFASQAELKRFFEAQPVFPKDLPNGQIRQQKVSDIISRVVYAGYVEHEPWGITRRQGHHEPIISLATYEAIQKRKATRPLAPARKDLNQDFPLRGFVTCAYCDKAMTAAWAKSRTGQGHAYYFCQTRGCEYRRKSIRRADVEGRFEDILQGLQPSQNLFEIMKAMLKQAWDMRLDQQGQQKAVIQKQIKAIDKDVAKTLDKIMQSGNATVIAAFEKRIEELETEKAVLVEKSKTSGKPKKNFAEIIEPPLAFVANPWNLYKNGSFAMKRLVLKLAFAGPLAYECKTGYRTAQPSDIFTFLENITSKCEMVPPHGLEPRTY